MHVFQCYAGANVEGRWDDIYEVVRPHIDDHVTSFNDNHIMLACLGAKKDHAVDEMKKSLTKFVE